MIDDPFQNSVLISLFIAVFAAALSVGAVARVRYGAPIVVAIVAGVTMWTGASTAGLAMAHFVGVIWSAAYVHPEFVWNFRFAGLLLVGLTLLTGGVVLMASALGVGRGRSPDWRRAVGGTLWLQLVSADVFLFQPAAAGDTFHLNLPPGLQPFTLFAQGAAIYASFGTRIDGC